jgi:hypothetical protein
VQTAKSARRRARRPAMIIVDSAPWQTLSNAIQCDTTFVLERIELATLIL